MKKLHIAYLACSAAIVGTGLGAAPSAAGHMIQTVRPGESIQKAVDAARPGDTVLVLPGVYHESVKVTTAHITLRGVGRRTVIEPGTKKAGDRCSEKGNGICVVGAKDRSLKGVTVASLTVSGFSGSGVFAMGTDGLTVRNVSALNNGVWGIAQERSVRSVLWGNTVSGSGDAGIFLANTITAEKGATDTEGTRVVRNRLQGNRVGVTVRRLRDLQVDRNYLTGNCVGVFVVGDENKPKAGDLAVRQNRIVANNKSCPKTARLPALQGSGIVLTGAEKTLVANNEIRDNAGTSPLSGGIVLFKSFVGTTSDDNRITGNRLSGNAPADLVNSDLGKGNTFESNTCRASKPAGLC
ncbi:right-handed parallel beta-helix repeat-containing protein [Streptomyces sp. NPDC005799]|uniref:right-handed parallel beta-helix repeat-containing protein n=1 Tax=Streptomyces sp. NPDC005799 TaxID=3154678 RepID=UPI0033CDECF7